MCIHKSTNLGNLTAYMRIHTGDMLQCDAYEYTTTHAGSLTTHMRKDW